VPAHQPLDPLAADDLALSPQLSMNARRAISLPVAGMNPLDIARSSRLAILRELSGRDRQA